MTFHGLQNEVLILEFTDFVLETGFDSLWIYEGNYPGGYLLGGFSGSNMPPQIISSEVMSIRFQSDYNTGATGWTALVESMMISVEEPGEPEISMKLYPNPASKILHCEISQKLVSAAQIKMYDLQGKLILEEYLSPDSSIFSLDVSELKAGVYLLVLSNKNSLVSRNKVLIY